MTETVNLEEFIDFYTAAKQATWASGRAPDVKAENQKAYTHTNGKFVYIDDCSGTYKYCGRETIQIEKTIFWALNYFGELLKGPDVIDSSEKMGQFANELFSFVREMRLIAPRGSVRGPSWYPPALNSKLYPWPNAVEEYRRGIDWNESKGPDVKFAENASQFYVPSSIRKGMFTYQFKCIAREIPSISNFEGEERVLYVNPNEPNNARSWVYRQMVHGGFIL